MKGIKFFVIVLAEALYSYMLCLYISGDSVVNKRSEKVCVSGELNEREIKLETCDIQFSKVNLGDTCSLELRILQVSGVQLETVLKECSCTTVNWDEERHYCMGDTIVVSVDMVAVERGLQMRRVHLLPFDDVNPISVTLLVDVD